MKPYCRIIMLLSLPILLSLPSQLAQAIDCPPGQLHWIYWYGGQPHEQCGCTLENPDIDPITGKPIPWIVDKAAQFYFAQKTFGTDWSYNLSLGVTTPWFYAAGGGIVNGVADGFTTSTPIPPIYGPTLLNDTQNWVATKTVPVYVTGGKLGTTWKNFSGPIDANAMAACNALYATEDGAASILEPVKPKKLAGGLDSICYLAPSGNTSCTVTNGLVDPSSTLVKSVSIDASDDYLCGLQPNGTVKCIDPFTKPTQYPSYTPYLLGQSLYAGYSLYGTEITNIVQTAFQKKNGCVLLKDGTVKCGLIGKPFWDTLALQNVTQIATSYGYSWPSKAFCALIKGGSIQCAGNTMKQSGMNYNYVFFPENFQAVIATGATDIASAGGATCAIVNGTTQCWKPGETPQTVPLLSPSTKLVASNELLCASTGSGMKCIKPSTSLTELAKIPYGIDKGFSDITTTSNWGSTNCVNTAATVRCWGDNIQAMGSFENLNGQPVCSEYYAACSGTSFGMGVGELIIDQTFNSSKLECYPAGYNSKVASFSDISCNNGVPSVKYPQATCNSATQTLPKCALGSPRCSANGLLVCGGEPADTTFAPNCKQGLPTCVKNPPYGLPSCIVIVKDPYNPTTTPEMGCVNAYGQKVYGNLVCNESGQATCTNPWKGTPYSNLMTTCPAEPTEADVPKCVPIDYGTPTCTTIKDPYGNIVKDSYGNAYIEATCTNPKGIIGCDSDGKIGCNAWGSPLGGGNPKCSTIDTPPTCVK